MHPQPCAKFGRALKLFAYRGRPEAEAALPNGAFDPYRKCGGSLLTALCWHLQRPTASVERAPYHKARLIQINAAPIRGVNVPAGGCEEFMKVHTIQAGSDRGPRAWPAATPATILLRRFEKAHPINLAQRAQRVKAGLPSRMERR